MAAPKKRILDHIRESIVGPGPQWSFVKIRKVEWSDKFEGQMRNRLVVGFYRYGEMRNSSKNSSDRIAYIKVKLARYEATGNMEALVDIANLALVEYVAGDKKERHFHAMDDTNEHM